jgi:hypothetical protein
LGTYGFRPRFSRCAECLYFRTIVFERLSDGAIRMDRKIAGLIGVVGALASLNTAQAAAPANPTEALKANTYADLLTPIPDALTLLEAIDKGGSDVEGKTQIAQYYDHHHHHHHNSYYRRYRPRVIVVPRERRFYHDHHHHHHHHSYYRRYRNDD